MPSAPTTRIPKRDRRISRPILDISFSAVNKSRDHIESALTLVAIIHKYEYTLQENTLSCTTETFTRSFFVRCVAPMKTSFDNKICLFFNSQKLNSNATIELAPKYSSKVTQKILPVLPFNKQVFSHRMRSADQIIVLPWFR